MNERILYDFKIELFNYCNEYYNTAINTKNNNIKKYYRELKRIYNDINNFKTYNQLVEYINKLKKQVSLNSNYYSIINSVIDIFNKCKNNVRKTEHLELTIYNLVKSYYDTYLKNKTIKNKNNYIFINKIYNKLKTLNKEQAIIYLDDLNKKEMYDYYQKIIISKIIEIYKQFLNYKETKQISRPLKIYNKVLLGRKEIDINVINENNLKIILSDRTRTLSSPVYSMKYENYLVCNFFDNYVVKSIIDNKGLSNNEINYLRQIDNEMENDPYLFFSLPLSNLSNETLRSYKKYMPNIDRIINNSQQLLNEIKSIEKKFYSDKISNFELEKLFKFLSYYINYNRVDNNMFDYESLIKFLLNKDKLTYYEISFIDKYLGYTYCIKNGLIDVEILFGNCDFAKYTSSQHALGIQDPGIILINKKHIVGTTFKNNTLSKPLALLNPFSQVYEGVSQLHTLYHELVHSQQFKDRDENKNTYRAYISMINSIIKNEDFKDEKRNYHNYETELDANMKSYDELEKTLIKYLPISIVLNNIKIHRKNYSDKLTFNYKVDDRFKKQITGKYEKDMADRFFRKNPFRLNDYPMFKQFYNNNGIPYNLEEMLSRTEFNDEGYYYNQLVGRIYQGEIFTKQNFLNKTQNQKIIMIKNINTTLKYINKRLSKAIKLLGKLNYLFYNQTGIPKNTLIDYNILVDLKIGNMFIMWHKNIFNVTPELKNIISNLDSNIINDYYNQSESFAKNEKLIRYMLYSEEKREMKI